jgi:translation elongation factor EF-Tu-like GTPase
MVQLILNESGPVPPGLEHVVLCDRMGVSYLELLATPAEVVEDYRAVMAAEAEAAEIRKRWGDR